MNRKPIIISLSGFKLTKKEERLIRFYKPWGIILFKRNIASFDQLKNLTKNIRYCIKDPYYPILVDEEGGNVSRFAHLINTREFSQNFFGKIYENNLNNGIHIYKYYLNSICSVLKKVGININTIPVMDLLQYTSHSIIKNRCFSKNKKTIKKLGNICVNTLKNNKIGSVAKHIPGHGSANADSHKKIPIVRYNIKKLAKNDFYLFKNLNSHFVMTAHVLFKKIDPKYVATQSIKIIKKIIRNKLKFKGLIISDDICMKALKGDLLLNAKLSLKSGCNIVLYCGGKSNESLKLLRGLQKIDYFTQKKTYQFYNFLR